MNHKQRRSVAKRLRAFRKLKDCLQNDMAAALGWDPAFYREVEAGRAGLSEGQQNDVRRVLKAEIAAATIRDRISSPKRGGIHVIRPEKPTGFVIPTPPPPKEPGP
jgi:transcriptional regulator with XRE-family HTH domain